MLFHVVSNYEINTLKCTPGARGHVVGVMRSIEVKPKFGPLQHLKATNNLILHDAFSNYLSLKTVDNFHKIQATNLSG